MSQIRPFRGLRPLPHLAAEVAAPPYDVLNSDEAREMAKGKPNTFLHVNKPEIDFPPDHDPTAPEVYRGGRKSLERLMNEGIMVRDPEPRLYLYRLTWRGRSQTGLMGLTSSDEYDRDLIKKHEHTRPDKVADRTNHMEAVGAHVGPVFSIFRDDAEILSLFAEVQRGAPEIDFTVEDHGVRHELWPIADRGRIDRFVAVFGRLPHLYIADGHHRSAAAAEYTRRARERNPNHRGDEHYNFFMNVIFPASHLRILPYHRVVKGLAGKSPEEFLAALGKVGTVSKADGPVEPRRPMEFGVYLKDGWRRLELAAPPESAAPADRIDSAVLTAKVLTPILGIENIRTDKRIDFVGGIRGVGELERLVNTGKADVAFSLHPATVEQLLAVADANQVMPPKSTWFEPKLRSGIVVNLLDE